MPTYSLYEIIKPKLGFRARRKLEEKIRANYLAKTQSEVKEIDINN